jgi:hypothetical protein
MFSKVYLNWRTGSGEPPYRDGRHEGNPGPVTPDQRLDSFYATLTVICLGCSSSGRGISISSIPSLNLALIRSGWMLWCIAILRISPKIWRYALCPLHHAISIRNPKSQIRNQERLLYLYKFMFRCYFRLVLIGRGRKNQCKL